VGFSGIYHSGNALGAVQVDELKAMLLGQKTKEEGNEI
jgi:hypothetical protein